jgi:hypothetical protein
MSATLNAAYAQQLALMLPYLLVVGAAVVLVTVLKVYLPQIKGRRGENVVDGILDTKLDPSLYLRLSNVMLPVPGGTTQIDHVVVSRFGIFVIETKNYNGWIFGNPNDAQWTKMVYREKYRFQNPLHQNAGHVRVLADLTGLPREFFKSIVVFLRGAEFKTAMPENVRHTDDLAAYIQSHQKPLLPADRMRAVVAQIQRKTATVSPELKANHVANLRKRHGG